MRRALARSAVLAVALTACGSRTGIDDAPFPSSTLADAGSHIRDATTSQRPPDSAGPSDVRVRDAGVDVFDRCPSAILVHAGLPMLGNCSTRDGRARIAGPKAPHVIWTTMVAAPASVEDLPTVALADASGFVYFLSPTGNMLLRIDGATGDVAWSSSFMGGPDDSFLLPNGTGATLGPRTNPLQLVLSTFDPASGNVTSRNFGSSIEAGIGMPGFYVLGAAPAIGDDGSFYFSYSKNNGPQFWYPALSRVLADGTLAWTSTTIYPMGIVAPLPSVAPIAIGKDGVVLVGTWQANAATSSVTALDPATGAVLWNTAIDGSIVGGPAIAPDGSIAVVTSTPVSDPYSDVPITLTLHLLEATGAVRHKVRLGKTESLPAGPTLYGIALDGTILVGDNDVIAVSSAGEVLWRNPAKGEIDAGFDQPPRIVVSAFLDGRDTVIVTYAGSTPDSDSSGEPGSIVGLDLATGETRWTLAPPEPPENDGGAVTLGPTSTVLTSAGGIVGFVATGSFGEYSYALFGASD